MIASTSIAWAARNPSRCPCRGWGWLHSDWDTYHKCPVHFRGQPHPEEEYPGFGTEAAYLDNCREAYASFGRESGLPPAAFKVACVALTEASGQAAPSGPRTWTDAAEAVAEIIAQERLDAAARRAGYSCRLEAALAAEAAVEASARHRGLDPDDYAPAGSPERANADFWYRTH